MRNFSRVLMALVMCLVLIMNVGCESSLGADGASNSEDSNKADVTVNSDAAKTNKDVKKTTIKLNKSKLTLRVYDSEQLKLTGTKAKVKWSTSNKKIVRVTKKGRVVALKKGNAVITAKCSGKTYKCKINVKKANKASALDDKEIDWIISTMSTSELIAQMMFVRCPASNAADIQKKYQFGAYILFGQDFANDTKRSIKSKIKKYQSVSNIPMLIGVDEEGGTVCRVSRYSQYRSTPFKSPRELYADGGYSLVEKNEVEKAKLLKSLGINVNFAPVCDIATNPSDYMYNRSFGGDAKSTSRFIKTVVKASEDNDVSTILKHFPGYGDNENTHTGIAIDNRSYSNFVKNDFVPFEGGMDAGAGCVLVSHNIVKCMDKKYPASLSSKVHKILRKELGFEGVIITDDLSMDAITKFTNGEDAAVKAVLAGNDLLCVSDYKTSYSAVVKAVKNGKISKTRIKESVHRILKWKFK